MGQRGDKLCLHFFILIDLIGHLVDGGRQISNFVVVFGADLHTVAAACNPLGRSRDLRHWLQNGADVEVAAENHHQHQQRPRRKSNENHKQQLSVDHFHAGHIPQHTDDLAAGIDHGTGDRHNPLSCGRIPAHIGGQLAGLHGAGNVLGRRRGSHPAAVGGSHNPAAGADKLQLNGVLLFEGPGIGDAGLVIRIVALSDVICKKLCGCLGPVFHIGLHVGVIIGGKGGGDDDHKDRPEGQNRPHRMGHPAAPQALDPVSPLLRPGLSTGYAPHL